MSGLTELALSRGWSTAAQAREFVAACLARRGLEERCDAATLVTSELVTNVLVHTDAVPTVRVVVAVDAVRIEVEDGCPVLPVAGILDPTAACGRGLVLVEQLTQRWGVTLVAGAGKAVWFELAAGGSAATEELSAEQLLELWGNDQYVVAAPAPVLGADAEVAEFDMTEPVQHVRIENIPTALLNGAKSHLDDLVRDCAAQRGGRCAGKSRR